MIEYPWPPRELSPNARCHWTVKNKAFQRYKGDAWAITKAAKVVGGKDNIHLKITYHPPSKRPMDLDNLLASSKALIDGMALAMNVNDKQFRPITLDIGETIKGGLIRICADSQ